MNKIVCLNALSHVYCSISVCLTASTLPVRPVLTASRIMIIFLVEVSEHITFSERFRVLCCLLSYGRV